MVINCIRLPKNLSGFLNNHTQRLFIRACLGERKGLGATYNSTGTVCDTKKQTVHNIYHNVITMVKKKNRAITRW